MSLKTKREFSFPQRIALALVPRLVAALVWLLSRTWKFELITDHTVEPTPFGQRGPAQVWCFWHQCVFACMVYFRYSRSQILVSSSFDGELIARTLHRYGYGTIRGSSSRGGVEGLIGLRNVLLAGDKPAVFTADGPRGPLFEAKAGPIKLAQKSGAPLVVFHPEPEHAWTLNSWDHFQIPKPFTRIVLSWSAGPVVPAKLTPDESEALRLQLTQTMQRNRQRALDHIAAHPGKSHAARC